jgi:hypothetical protein
MILNLTVYFFKKYFNYIFHKINNIMKNPNLKFMHSNRDISSSIES